MKLETRLDAESRGDKTVALLPYQEKAWQGCILRCMSIGEVVRGIMTSRSISIWSGPIAFGAWVNPIQSLLNMAVMKKPNC